MYVGKIKTGKSYKKIIILFLFVSIILISFVVYASFSNAVIKITPKKENISFEYETKIESNKDIDLAQLQNINGRVIQTEVEDTVKIDDIPLKEVDSYAKVKATVINNLDQSQSLLPSTQLMSDAGVLFRTDERINVPAHSKVEVGITADQKGTSGNISPDHFTIVKIWSHWQDLIYAETKEAAAGGTIEAKVATEEELARGKEIAMDEEIKKGMIQLSEQLSGTEEILEKAMKIEEMEINYSIDPDMEVEEYEIFLKLKITAVIFNEKTLIDLGIAKAKRDLSGSKEFLGYNTDKTTYDVVEYNLDENWAKVKVIFEGYAVSKLGNQAFEKDKLTGRSKEEVERYYDSLGDIEDISISFTPFWVSSVPSLKDHIEIIVEK